MLVQTLSSRRSAGNIGKEVFSRSFYSRGIECRQLGHSLVGWWIREITVAFSLSSISRAVLSGTRLVLSSVKSRQDLTGTSQLKLT